MGELNLYATGAPYLWTVPDGVTAVGALVCGGWAQGIEAIFAVTPGEVFQINVGGPPNHFFGTGGWNGGADGPVAPALSTPDPHFPLGQVSGASWGCSDVRRNGTANANRIMVAGGRGGAAWDYYDPMIGVQTSEGDAGLIDGSLGYSILGPQPGPTDPPRAPRTTPPSGYTLDASGHPGNTTLGDPGFMFIDGVHATGAGGGGYGGGASGSVYEFTDPDPPPDIYLPVGGNTGGWFAADGYTAIASDFNDLNGGYVRLQWTGTDTGGWSVGHLGL